MKAMCNVWPFLGIFQWLVISDLSKYCTLRSNHCQTLLTCLVCIGWYVRLTSFCHLSDMTRGKFLYNSWSASVSFNPFVSSSSKEPMSKASAALTSPRGGMRGGGYFCWYTWTQSTPVKKGWFLSSSAPCPPQPSLLSTSLCSKQMVNCILLKCFW